MNGCCATLLIKNTGKRRWILRRVGSGSGINTKESVTKRWQASEYQTFQNMTPYHNDSVSGFSTNIQVKANKDEEGQRSWHWFISILILFYFDIYFKSLRLSWNSFNDETYGGLEPIKVKYEWPLPRFSYVAYTNVTDQHPTRPLRPFPPYIEPIPIPARTSRTQTTYLTWHLFIFRTESDYSGLQVQTTHDQALLKAL